MGADQSPANHSTTPSAAGSSPSQPLSQFPHPLTEAWQFHSRVLWQRHLAAEGLRSHHELHKEKNSPR